MFKFTNEINKVCKFKYYAVRAVGFWEWWLVVPTLCALFLLAWAIFCLNFFQSIFNVGFTKKSHQHLPSLITTNTYKRFSIWSFACLFVETAAVIFTGFLNIIRKLHAWKTGPLLYLKKDFYNLTILVFALLIFVEIHIWFKISITGTIIRSNKMMWLWWETNGEN